MLGSPHVWSSSREKPQVQPTKSINKLISKYCCLQSRTGTPGEKISNQRPQGMPGTRAPFFSGIFKAPVAPRTRNKVGGRGQQGAAGGQSLLSTKMTFHPQLHLSSSLAPVHCFLPRAGLGAQLAGALIWVPGMMLWVKKEPRITRGTN